MATMTTGTLTGPIKTYYDLVLLERAIPNLIHDQAAQTKNLPRGKGKTIEFRRYGALALATTPLTEGQPPAGKTLSVTQITGTPAQYGDFLRYSDLLNLVSIDPLLTEGAEILGDQSGQTLDAIIRDVIVAGTNVVYADGVGDRSSVAAANILDADDLIKAVANQLNKNSKPVRDGMYLGLMHPFTWRTLIKDPDIQASFLHAEARGPDNPIFRGEIGDWMGVRWLMSTQCKVFSGAGSGGIDVYATLILGQNAYGTVTITPGQSLENIVKQLGSAGTYDPLDQVSTQGWKALTTAVILNDNFMVNNFAMTKPPLNIGKAYVAMSDMVTRGKQAKAVQPQRLSEGAF